MLLFCRAHSKVHFQCAAEYVYRDVLDVFEVLLYALTRNPLALRLVRCVICHHTSSPPSFVQVIAFGPLSIVLLVLPLKHFASL
jgi:hypothetical protein